MIGCKKYITLSSIMTVEETVSFFWFCLVGRVDVKVRVQFRPRLSSYKLLNYSNIRIVGRIPSTTIITTYLQVAKYCRYYNTAQVWITIEISYIYKFYSRSRERAASNSTVWWRLRNRPFSSSDYHLQSLQVWRGWSDVRADLTMVKLYFERV